MLTLGFVPVLFSFVTFFVTGGDEEIRTLDPLLAGQVLSQLSYTPVAFAFRVLTFTDPENRTTNYVTYFSELFLTFKLVHLSSFSFSFRPFVRWTFFVSTFVNVSQTLFFL